MPLHESRLLLWIRTLQLCQMLPYSLMWLIILFWNSNKSDMCRKHKGLQELQCMILCKGTNRFLGTKACTKYAYSTKSCTWEHHSLASFFHRRFSFLIHTPLYQHLKSYIPCYFKYILFSGH